MGEKPGEFFIFSMKPSCSTEIGMYVTPTYRRWCPESLVTELRPNCRDRKEPSKIVIFTYAFEFIDINSIKLYNIHYSRINILKNTYQHNMKMLWCVFIFCIGTWGFGGYGYKATKNHEQDLLKFIIEL